MQNHRCVIVDLNSIQTPTKTVATLEEANLFHRLNAGDTSVQMVLRSDGQLDHSYELVWGYKILAAARRAKTEFGVSNVYACVVLTEQEEQNVIKAIKLFCNDSDECNESDA